MFLFLFGKRQFIVALGACACISAFAGSFDTVHPYVAFVESYDANLLGLPNSAVAQAMIGSTNTGDTSHTEQAGIAFDDTVGLQHLTADVSESKTDFDRYIFKVLDYHAANVQGNWNWYLGDHLYGNLGATYVQSLAPYAFFHLLEQNLRAQRKQNADITWLFHPNWAAVASVTGSQLSYDLAVQQPYSRNEYHVTEGIDYLEANGSTVGVRVGHIRGYFPFPQTIVTQAPGTNQVSPITEQVVNNYSQDEIKGKIDWRFSGKTRIQFLGGWVKRNYDFQPVQDYSGLNGRAIVDWAPTGKLTVNVTAWREIAAVDDLTTVYSTNRGISVAPAWLASDKIRWDIQYQFEERDFAQSPTLSAAPVSGVNYLLRNASIMLTYSPTPHWRIQSSIYYLTQSTSDHSNDFGGNGMTVSSRYQF